MDDFALLLEQASTGDAMALASLCRHYEPQVRVVARVLLGPALRPHLDTVDILQSVHKSLLIGIRDEKFHIRTPENLVALASTMVRRKVARNWRRHRRQLRLDPLPNDGDTLALTLCSLTSREVNPTESIEFAEELKKLLHGLRDEDRRLLQLRLDGTPPDEICVQLGIHPVAMRVRWTRLRQKLEKTGIMADWL